LIPPETLDRLRDLPGLIATVITSGAEDPHYGQAFSDLRSWNDRNAFHRVEYLRFHCPFVEQGRDEVIAHALKENYAWTLQIDADAAPFPPDSLAKMLHTAFVVTPDADVVGAYCQLKNPPYLPTIDTGSGTWEVHYPGEGVLPVIRTGGHFLLVKPEICRRFGPPWFRTRRTIRPIDALAEIDNLARITEDGKNALTETETWKRLVAKARDEGGGAISTVGEDSGFSDAILAAGGRIYVDTDIYVGHVGKRVITPDLLAEEMEDRAKQFRAAVGVWE
jgi:hypothetical protein